MASGADPSGDCDVAVVGAGIVGLAVARELAERHPRLSIRVLEREARPAVHQTGRNSGVVHSGVYYAPGSLKARLCVEGARRLYDYCDRRGVPYERCGKVIVALGQSELPALAELERRGRANGVPGLRRLDAHELRAVEPHARGLAALHSPATGIVDFAAVAGALRAELEEERGVDVALGCEVTGARRAAPRAGTAAGAGGEPRAEPRPRTEASAAPPARLALATSRGEVRPRAAIFCAGLDAERLAVACGGPREPRIVPFRGAYLRLRPERRELVRALIYPVPDPRLPFLGVHLSRHPSGEVLIGPTALLGSVRALAWGGTLRLMRRFWRTGVAELRHAVSRRALARAAARYVPELEPGDVLPGPSGVRAQALARDGELLEDFAFSVTERALHVRNAPSPAATSSLAIARTVADRAEAELGVGA